MASKNESSLTKVSAIKSPNALLSTDIFLQENLSILRDLVFTYLWFLKPIYVFFWSFPAAILGTIKFIVNTWLGFWLLPIAKNMK